MAWLSLLDRFRIPNFFKASQITGGLLDIDAARCNACGICVSICPARSLLKGPKDADGKRTPPTLAESAPDVSMCIACGDCLAACPENAIRIARGFEASRFFRKLTQTGEVTFPRKY